MTVRLRTTTLSASWMTVTPFFGGSSAATAGAARRARASRMRFDTKASGSAASTICTAGSPAKRHLGCPRICSEIRPRLRCTYVHQSSSGIRDPRGRLRRARPGLGGRQRRQVDLTWAGLALRRGARRGRRVLQAQLDGSDLRLRLLRLSRPRQPDVSLEGLHRLRQLALGLERHGAAVERVLLLGTQREHLLVLGPGLLGLLFALERPAVAEVHLVTRRI